MSVTLITGAAGGIGRALALALRARGDTVVATDIDAAGLDRLHAEHPAIETAVLDVTDQVAVERVVADLVARHGRLDTCISNAGIGFAGEFRDSTLGQFRRLLEINTLGMIGVAHAAYRQMVAQGGGQLVTVASVAGLIPSPRMTAYAASKWAMVGFSRSLRLEGTGLGVKVNCVCPAFIDTGIYEASESAGMPPGTVRKMVPFPMIPVDDAARRILRGMARDDELIVFPGYAKGLWWAIRLAPWVLYGEWRRQLAAHRAKYRSGSAPRREA